ncbi:MAG TPA: DUF1588 domain-containing protein [Polyangia bacterium]|nr:DUF1588 domain-containing protein [Polyangia bacterium]
MNGNFAADFAGGADTELDDLGVEQRANAAATVAQQAAQSFASWGPCDPVKAGAAACEQQVIDKVGARAVRHPLSDAERVSLTAVFDAGVKEKDFATGVEWFVSGLLQLPDFLYQIAKPAPAEQPGQIRPLPSADVASRLSFFIWDSLPDDALLSAGTSGQLTDKARLQTEVDRLMRDQRFLRGAGAFYSDWLTLDRFSELAHDDPGFTSAVAQSLHTSVLMTATQLYTQPTAKLADLLGGQTYYLDGALRMFYGLPAGAADFTPATFPGEARRGLLTHPGLMALLARPNETNPIARGLFVRRGLLCQEIPPPPNAAIPALPPIQPGLSTRDRLEQHTTNATCKTCHDLIDPPGFAFENWDQVGRFRTMDSGKQVDTSVNMVQAGDLNGTYAQGDAFLQRVGGSGDVQRCFAQKYLAFAVERALASADACSLQQVQGGFASSGDLRALVSAIASSDSFRQRLTEGVAP